MKISVRGAVVGIVLSASMVLLLLVVPQMASSLAGSYGVTVFLRSIFFNPVSAVLVVGLASITFLNHTIKQAPRFSGALKVFQGVLLGLYYYVTLGGGSLPIILAAGELQLRLLISLGLVLLLFEMSAAMLVIQGTLTYASGRTSRATDTSVVPV